ncbi:MAG: hypothetical protein IKR57_00555 [Bacilli bacterium]|nr:hypothetical protein [Bacilli bacterium]
MKVIFIIITVIVLIDFLCNIINYFSAKNAFKNKKKKLHKDKSNMYILLPVYKEEKIAEVMVDRFYKLSKETNIKTIIITTVKEKSNKTHKIIENKIKREKLYDYIKLIKCDIKDGTMATQLNYGLEYLNKIDKSNYIFGIHNADGQITKEHIEFVKNNIDERTCIQSYSYFKYNGNILLNGAISWQNRWSYIFEAGRCNLKLGKSALFKKMNYVIGHGLYMKASCIKDCGYFPEDTINEDEFLGVILNYKKYNIIPMPYLEEAEFAPNARVYIKQQSVWYNGPKMSFNYLKRIITNTKNVRYERNIYNKSIKDFINLFIICFKLFLHAIYWISAVYILFILYSYVSYKLFGIYGILYVIIINYLNLLLFNYLSYKQIVKETNDKFRFPILELPITFYFIHSFGPIINVIRSVLGKNTIKNKYKTER